MSGGVAALVARAADSAASGVCEAELAEVLAVRGRFDPSGGAERSVSRLARLCGWDGGAAGPAEGREEAGDHAEGPWSALGGGGYRPVVQAAPGAVQLRVYPQRREGACGFHALHNAMGAVLALCAGNDADARRVWLSAVSGASFYRTFFSARREMRAACGEGSVRDEVVERTPMAHLVSGWPPAARLAPALMSAPEFTCEAAAEIDRSMAGLRGGAPGVRAIVVGAVYHWVAVVAARARGAPAGAPVEIALLDSYNRPSLDVRIGQARAYAAAHAEIKDDAEKQMLYVRSRRRIAQWLACVREAARPGGSVRGVYLRWQVHAMVRSFRLLVAEPRPAAGDPAAVDSDGPIPDVAEADAALRGRTGVSAAGLDEWLRDYYPPALLVKRDAARLEELGAGLAGPQARNAVRTWAAAVREAAAGAGDGSPAARAVAAAALMEGAFDAPPTP